MRAKKLIAGGFTAASVMVAVSAISAAPASAATYNGVCGTGYKVVNSTDIGVGNIFLTYNSSNGYNCVVTVRDNPYLPVYMLAEVKRSSVERWAFDSGQYTAFAGPVYTYGANSCVDWAGEIGSHGATNYGTNCH
jgi:hypothetical protein